MDELKAALQAAELAGAILRKHFLGSPAVRGKGYRDVVTDADLEAENALKTFFAQNFPSHRFIGEETSLLDGFVEEGALRKFFDEGRTWVVDPLDGTREFAMGIPYFSVSVSLLEGRRTLLGAVYNPISNELFHAEAGKGAFKNGVPIRCGTKTALRESLATGCFVYSRPELAKFAYANNVFLLNYSPALDLCGVASGRTDATVYTFCNFADNSAGALIAREAGAVVSNFGRSSFNPFDDGVMAANPALHEQLCKLFPRPLAEISYEEKQYETKFY